MILVDISAITLPRPDSGFLHARNGGTGQASLENSVGFALFLLR